MLERNLFSAPEGDFREILYFRKKKKRISRLYKLVLLERYVISRNRRFGNSRAGWEWMCFWWK